MHIHFEKTINAYCDCTILSMSWMGKVPDELPEDEGWKLNRTHYYQEGWLATGNVRGVLGVTYTTSHWKKNPSEVPHRTNYNLRGHRSQITLVQWNEPYQKLASCDSSGIIFVWIKFEGRWSIELINDRNTPVTHFSWSHDGRMALICYQDNFVLVGSVAGQRYWSTLLNLEATITCGIWTPDDQQVYFGTSNGQVVVMDVHGVMLSQVQLPSDSPISSMAWSCEKFKMEESEDGEATSSSNHYCNKRPFLLAVCIKTGGIYLMKSYDDVAPIYVSTGMHGLHIEWSNSGEFLAVAGSRPIEVLHENGNRVKEYSNSLHVYNHQGVRIVNINIPHVLSPVTSMTWGHNDKRIFVATGKLIHVGWVSKRIASLQLLCRLAIYKSLSTETCVSHLPLPLPVRALISSLHTQTIPSLLPNIKDMRDFVSHPPNSNLRLYCTMIRHEEDSNQSPGTAYTLYLEYMGGLIPILKGKRTSKIRPEFVIYDPQAAEERGCGLPFSHGATGDMRNGNGGMVAGSGMGGNGGGGYCCHCNGSHHTYHQQRHSQLPSNAGTEGGSCPGGSYCHPVAICSCSASHFGENGIDNGLADSGIGQNPCHCHCCCHSQHYHHHYQNSSSNKSSSGGGCASVHHGQSSSNFNSSASTTGSSVVSLGFSDSSESEDVELCASPRMQRKRYRNRQRERERLLEREREREWERTRSSVHLLPEPAHPHQLIYNDVLPEANRLVEVTSNIWGTKFKIHGVAPSLPDSLGQVTYKTSLLHLQPRQMTLLITELRDDIFFSPETLLVHGTYADEDEEDLSIVVGGPDASTTAASLRASAQFQNNQQMGGGMQHGAIIVQNGVGMAGNIFRGNAYTGSNVIYHPQGVPRGEDSPPIISTSRCYLQSSSSSSSSSNNQGYSQPHDHHHHHHNSQHNSCSSSSTQGASCSSTSSPLHQRHHHHHQHPGSSNGDCPSSSSVASSSSCCSSNQSVPQYYASSCSSSSKTTPRSSEFTSCHFDVEDQDEFPYVDFTANSDIIQFRETLRNNWNYEQGLSSAMDGNMCQVCEPYPVPASPQIPMKVVGGGTSVGIASCPIEASLFTDRSIQKGKHGLAMEGNGGMYECSSSGGEGMAPDTPTHTSRNPARSLRSPKKVSGRLVGGGSLRMSSYQNNAQVANQDLQPAHRQLRQEPSYSHQHQLPLHLQQQQQMQPVPVTAPMFVRRSISASYLDSVERNLAPSLDIVGNEPGQNSPPKRLILVKKSGKEEGEDSSSNFGFKGKPRLKDWGKSKSWDSCDLSAWKNKNGKAKEVCLDGTLKNGCGPSYASASSYRKDILTSSCPKCRFPSTEPVRRCVTILAEPLLQCRANASSLRTPNTPVRRNTMGTSSNAVASPHLGGGRNSNGRQTPTAGSSSSGEDVIELVGDHPSRPPTPIQSTPLHHASPAPSPPPPVSQSPPPPPSTVHRRSLSLLTPLLRRREMLNAGRQQSSNEGNKQQRDRNSTQGNSQQQSSTNGGSSNNAPHSSSFIPPGSPQHQPRSSPSTPASQRRSRQSYLSSASSPFRQLFINSPLLTRRKSKGGNNNNNNSAGGTNTLGRHQRRKSIIDSSDEEGYFEDGSRSRPQQQQLRNDNLTGSRNNCVICSDMGSPCTHASVPSSSVPCVHNTPFRGEFGGGIETLQKSQQKMGRKKIQCMESCVVNPRRREFLMHNKAPMWNENSQVYQLDFGGRVTQESAKNFQIEFRGKQVMQFGRIDGSAYTLDFQYPFAAVQAFSVALANVTQRLK